jgi:hypothetical protein
MKKRRVEPVALTRSIDIEHDARDIGIGMYNKIYVVSRVPSSRRYVERFHLNGILDMRFTLTESNGSVMSGHYHPTSIQIDTTNGMNLDTWKEALTVPELYAFPPGVLPICLSYLGDDIIFVAFVTDQAKHMYIAYDTNGRFIRRVDTNHTWRADISNGYIYSIHDSNMHIHAIDGTLIRTWEYTPSTIFSVCLVNDLICMISDSLAMVYCFNTLGSFVRKFEVISDHETRNIYCEYNGTLLVCSNDFYGDCKLRVIRQYDTKGHLVKSRFVDHLNLRSIRSIVSVRNGTHICAMHWFRTSQIHIISL